MRGATITCFKYWVMIKGKTPIQPEMLVNLGLIRLTLVMQ